MNHPRAHARAPTADVTVIHVMVIWSDCLLVASSMMLSALQIGLVLAATAAASSPAPKETAIKSMRLYSSFDRVDNELRELGIRDGAPLTPEVVRQRALAHRATPSRATRVRSHRSRPRCAIRSPLSSDHLCPPSSAFDRRTSSRTTRSTTRAPPPSTPRRSPSRANCLRCRPPAPPSSSARP